MNDENNVSYIVLKVENLDSDTDMETFNSKDELMMSLKLFAKNDISSEYNDDREEDSDEESWYNENCERVKKELKNVDNWSFEETIQFIRYHGNDPFTLNQDGQDYRKWAIVGVIEGTNMTKIA
eukprot:CAMPEP_0114358232 /NCGR_PEP_ID=MMETSP0101-20121206/22164_1 /TAXON_ID=38822 ORGANISM="Pteridomonas danica, Strain PT" /NCGR_SAMPLE_ID=MMETSP0101 /ASSEMBLY_ACC=CAM_ASM_000211 /LENGTH=123 /DNA_ID=CAMNT_0001501275 /DNA_START=56 /DNA_END=427 /DNA_ORIENTATION=+